MKQEHSMKSGSRGRTLEICCLALMMAGLGAFAETTLPVHEGFESYADSAALNSSTLTNQGWGASSSAVVIRTVTNVADAVRGTNALAIPGNVTVSNVVTLTATSNVWTEVYVNTNMAMPAGEPAVTDVDTSQVAIVFLNTNGCPVAWDRTGGVWRVYTQDVWQTNVSTFATSAWARLTLCHNYSSKTVSLFLNEHLMVTGLPFINTNQTGYAEFTAIGGGSVTSYLDEVSARYEPPTNNWTADLDNDNVLDALEIQLYGNMTTARRLTITAAMTNLTAGTAGGGTLLQPAINPFTVVWTPVTTNLQWQANPNLYVADVLTNNGSVGNFSGKDTGSVTYPFTTAYADATVTVAFAAMPVITASNSAYGVVTPASTNCYPGNSRTFTFQTTNSHYFISGLLTNGYAVTAGGSGYTGWGTTNGDYTWPDIRSNSGLEVQYAHKYTNSVAVLTVGGPGGVGGSVTASTNEVFPGESVTFTLTPNPTYGVTALTNNGQFVAALGGCLSETNYTFSNVQTDLNLQVLFSYTAVRRVPGDYNTLDDAKVTALPGDTFIVMGGSTAGGLILSNMTLIATNTTIQGGLTVTTGTLANCTGLTNDSTTVSGLLVVSNGSVNVGALTLQAGATVQVVNATAFTANGATLTGTVTLAYGWDSTVVPQTPPCHDPFDQYAVGTKLKSMAYFGWDTVSDGVLVQTNEVWSGRAVTVPPADTLRHWMTNAPSAGTSNVWAEVYVSTNMAMPADEPTVADVDASQAAIVFLNTNGCPVVWDPTGSVWRVYTQDVWQTAVSQFATSAWSRLTLCQNYSNKTVALFLNDHLMFSGLQFIDTNRTRYAEFTAVGGSATSHLDEVSFRCDPPTNNLTADLDNDGMEDALEIHLYGNVTNRHRPVISVTATGSGSISPSGSFDVLPGAETNFTLTANPGFYVATVRTNGTSAGNFTGQYSNSASYIWSDIIPDGLSNGTFEAVFVHKPQLTVASVAEGGTNPTGGVAALSATEVFPNGVVSCTMTAAEGYVVASLTTNGVTAVTFAGQPATAFCTISNIWADMTVTSVFAYSGVRLVTNDYPTIADALAAAKAGDMVVVTPGSYTNDLTLGKTVTIKGTNVAIVGSVNVQGGVTGTWANCLGLTITGTTTVAAGGLMVVSNGTIDVGTLNLEVGATVQVVNATAFTANGVTFTGTHTLASNWYVTVVAQTPPYSDSFDADRYAVGTKLLHLGVFGWDTASEGVVVETNQVQSGQAVTVPASATLISQMTATPASNIWVQCYFQDTNRVTPQELALYDLRTDIALAMVIVTNGYLAVYDPQKSWVVCSNDFYTVPMDKLASNAWPRVAVNLNYKTGKAAVFLDGRLLLQQVSFRNPSLKNSGQFEILSGFGGASWLDGFNVWTNASPGMSLSGDGDSVSDAVEIDLYGDVFTYPRGSVFTIR